MHNHGPRNAVTIILIVFLLGLPFASAGDAADGPAALRAGAAAVDVTPKEFPLNMPGDFAARMADVALKYRRPTAEQVAGAKEVLAVTDEDAIRRLPQLAQRYARNVVAASQRKEDSLCVKLQAIRVGDLAICGIPFEAFVETGLDLKHRSPFAQTMVIGLANGRHGYLPTPEQHRLGGYETRIGTNVVQEDASVIVTDNLLEMPAELNKAE